LHEVVDNCKENSKKVKQPLIIVNLRQGPDLHPCPSRIKNETRVVTLYQIPFCQSPSTETDPNDRGIVLISVLVTLILLASVAVMTQQVALSSARVLDRLTDLAEESFDVRSVHAIATPAIGMAMFENVGSSTHIENRLNGTPRTIGFEGKEYLISTQDVEAVPDLFLTPPDAFDALFGDGFGLRSSDIRSFRAEHTRSTVYSVRQALSLIGQSPEFHSNNYFTIRAQSPKLNIRNQPIGYLNYQENLPRHQIMSSGAVLVRVAITAIAE